MPTPAGSLPAEARSEKSLTGLRSAAAAPDRAAARIATAALLTDLLADAALPYRARWERQATRGTPSGAVNQRAVARVLAGHLVEVGLSAVDDPGLERSCIHRVGRALNGRSITVALVHELADAFDMPARFSGELLRRLAGEEPVGSWVHGGLGSLGQALPYRILQLMDRHTLGPTGQPVRHGMHVVIEALEDDVRHYRMRFDTDRVTFEMRYGGTPGPLQPSVLGLYAMDVELPRPLERGQHAAVAVVTHFDYRDIVPPVFRRRAVGRIETALIRVEFDPDRMPAAIWHSWSTDPLGPLQEQTWPAELDAEHSLSRYAGPVEDAVIGFGWRFD